MDNTREKLIELLKESGVAFPISTANFLVANGVTVQKWIPVTERLPQECEDVLVYRFSGCEVDSCVSRQRRIDCEMLQGLCST